jgi:hypothetical protein
MGGGEEILRKHGARRRITWKEELTRREGEQTEIEEN